VLFYFHAHYEYNHQLSTPTFRGLLERVDNVFMEGVSDDGNIVDEAEENWNDCIRSDSLRSNRFELGYQYMTVLRWLLGTNKRIKLERSFSKSDYEEKTFEATFAFLNARFEDAPRYQKRLLKELVGYQDKREENVFEQICALDGTTLVIFGAFHKRLADLVSSVSPCEVYYPFRNRVFDPFFSQLMKSVRGNGQAYNLELALRSLAETLTIRAISSNYKRWTSNEQKILAHYYARIFSTEQILDFREIYLHENDDLEKRIKILRSDRVDIRESLRLLPPFFKAFKQICVKYCLPLPENLPKRILEGAR